MWGAHLGVVGDGVVRQKRVLDVARRGDGGPHTRPQRWLKEVHLLAKFVAVEYSAVAAEAEEQGGHPGSVAVHLDAKGNTNG